MTTAAIMALLFGLGVVVLVAWLNGREVAHDVPDPRAPVEVAKRALREHVAIDGVWRVSNDYQWVYVAPHVYAVITFIDREDHVFELELTMRGRTSIHLLKSVEDAMMQAELAALVVADDPEPVHTKW